MRSFIIGLVSGSLFNLRLPEKGLRMFATQVADVFHFLQQVHIAGVERCDAGAVGWGAELLEALGAVHDGFVVLC